MYTATRSLYKIWRFESGRSFKRWLTDERVAYYKRVHPHWRWRKVQEKDFTSQEAHTQQAQSSYQTRQAQSSQSVYARPSNDYVGVNHNRYWGKNTSELRDTKRQNPHNALISWDDILDVQLALKKGI